MKSTGTILVAIALSAATAQAQTINLSTMSCQDFVQADAVQINTIVSWLLGYYTDPAAPQIIDLGRLNTTRESFLAFCKQQPQFRVETAAEGILDK